MGDSESRLMDALAEVWFEKARRTGEVAECYHCGEEDFAEYGAYDDERIPLCHPCMKEHQAKH